MHSMRRSTAKKIKEKRNNLPMHFVDSSVFVEVILKQPCYEQCLSFFNRAKYKYRLTTSTVVLGEVIKTLSSADEKIESEGLVWIKTALRSNRVAIFATSYASLSNISAVRDSDSFIASADALNFSIAVTESCNAFITLDSDFTKRLETDFRINIRKPQDT